MADKETKKPVMDVEKPGTTPASATSRPVIVGRGPAIKDPMVNTSDPESTEQTNPQPLPSAKKKTIQPISEQPATEADTKPEVGSEPKPEATGELAPELPPTEAEERAAAADAAEQLSEEDRKRQELTDKLVAEKKYFVPIGAAQKKRTARNTALMFVVFVVVVGAALLAVDAELIQTDITLPFDLIK